MKVRILEHHIWLDQIRIGTSHNVEQELIPALSAAVLDAYARQYKVNIDQLDEKFEKYYKSIRIVDANDLKTIRVIYDSKTPIRERANQAGEGGAGFSSKKGVTPGKRPGDST